MLTEKSSAQGVRMNIERLPQFLKELFWQYDFATLRWPECRDIVIRQILTEGGRASIEWLRTRVSDDEVREWLTDSHGRQLSKRDLRFWQFMLDIPDKEIAEWLNEPGRRIWDQRDCAA